MINKEKIKERRRERLRKKIKLKQKILGAAEVPRLVVFRSSKHIYAQIVNDIEGKIITSASSLKLRDEKKTKTEKAVEVGKMIAEKCLALGIKKVKFDRNKYKYHGRVKALAESARNHGLEF